MLQCLDAELETRTGLSKQTQGIDANALQNQPATAVAQVFSASQMRIKLIARIMAEGVRDIFALLHGTIRKHGQQLVAGGKSGRRPRAVQHRGRADEDHGAQESRPFLLRSHRC